MDGLEAAVQQLINLCERGEPSGRQHKDPQESHTTSVMLEAYPVYVPLGEHSDIIPTPRNTPQQSAENRGDESKLERLIPAWRGT